MTTVLPPVVDPLRRAPSTNSKMVLPRVIRLSAMGLALAGVAAFGVIVYSAYQDKPTPDQVPMITADNSPLRERPAYEGGMQVANRDSTVYSQLDGQGSQPGLERLMPPAEQPVDGPAALDPAAPGMLGEPRRPDGTPALTGDEIRMMHQQRRILQQRGDASEQAMQQLSEVATNLPQGAAQGQISTVIAQAERIEPPAAPAPVAAAPQIVAAAPAPAPAPAPTIEGLTASATSEETEQPLASLSQAQVVAQRTSQPPVVTPQEERQVAAIAPAAGAVSGRVVQLGAVRTEEAAKAEWTRLQAKYRRQLGSLQPQIERADLGARGIYWRIRGGSVTEAEGKSICEALKAAGQSCLVVVR